MEDVLLSNKNYITNLRSIDTVLFLCRAHGIILNADKFVVATPDVYFSCYRLSGRRQTRRKCELYQTSPRQRVLTDLRSFMALVNQLVKFPSRFTLLSLEELEEDDQVDS